MFIFMILLMYTVANASQFYLDLVNSMFSNSLHIFVQMDISVYHQLYAIYLDELCVHQHAAFMLFVQMDHSTSPASVLFSCERQTRSPPVFMLLFTDELYVHHQLLCCVFLCTMCSSAAICCLFR